MLAVGSWVVA